MRSSQNARVTIDCGNLEIVVHYAAVDATLCRRVVTRATVLGRVEAVARMEIGEFESLDLMVTNNTIRVVAGDDEDEDAAGDEAIEAFGNAVAVLFGHDALNAALGSEDMIKTSTLPVQF